MTSLPQSQSFTPPSVGEAPVKKPPPRPSRLLSNIYRDIGLAAVAISLEIPVEGLEPEVHEAVRRGSRYIFLMPKRQDAPALQAAE